MAEEVLECGLKVILDVILLIAGFINNIYINIYLIYVQYKLYNSS